MPAQERFDNLPATDPWAKKYGSELPPFPQQSPNYKFVFAKPWGSVLYVSGYGPFWGDNIEYTGLVSDSNVDEGALAARLTTLNLLRIVQQSLGTLDRVDQILEVEGFVASAPKFYNQIAVMNGCSQLLLDIFQHSGTHTRAALVAPWLTLNLMVEIKMSLSFFPPR